MKFYALILCLLVSSVVANNVSHTESQQNLSDYEIAIWTLKQYEGLHYTPYWDYSQYTIGWGTKADKDDHIDYDEANHRTRQEYQRRYNRISKRYPKLTRFQKLVITNFNYNTPIGTQLDAALKAGDIKKAKRIMRLYVHAGGKKLRGLVYRRNREAWLMTATPAQRQRYGLAAKKKVIRHIEKAARRSGKARFVSSK